MVAAPGFTVPTLNTRPGERRGSRRPSIVAPGGANTTAGSGSAALGDLLSPETDSPHGNTTGFDREWPFGNTVAREDTDFDLIADIIIDRLFKLPDGSYQSEMVIDDSRIEKISDQLGIPIDEVEDGIAERLRIRKAIAQRHQSGVKLEREGSSSGVSSAHGALAPAAGVSAAAAAGANGSDSGQHSRSGSGVGLAGLRAEGKSQPPTEGATDGGDSNGGGLKMGGNGGGGGGSDFKGSGGATVGGDEGFTILCTPEPSDEVTNAGGGGDGSDDTPSNSDPMSGAPSPMASEGASSLHGGGSGSGSGADSFGHSGSGVSSASTSFSGQSDGGSGGGGGGGLHLTNYAGEAVPLSLPTAAADPHAAVPATVAAAAGGRTNAVHPATNGANGSSSSGGGGSTAIPKLGLTLHASAHNPKFDALRHLPADRNAQIAALTASVTTPKLVATPKVEVIVRKE